MLAAALLPVGCGRQAASVAGPTAMATDPAAEVLARAGRYASQTRLVVDYYRIYRQLAYPLPVTRVDNPPLAIEDNFSYPWEIWMLWELEERVNCLGWAGQWSGDSLYRRLAQTDLEALAGWETYKVQHNPHLSVGHAARIMAGAWRHWDWLDGELKAKLESACRRLVDQQAAWLAEGRIGLQSAEAVLAGDESLLHNIPVIATLGMSMAARVCDHPLREELERHALALVLAELELRSRGQTEAISYDGYVLDFVADWLEGAPEAGRQAVLDHPQLGVMLGQAALLAAPGCALRFAPFNDVEPREMPFHAGAQAKFLSHRLDGRAAWYLARFPLSALRSDGLAALQALGGVPPEREAPAPGATAALYALVLRSGWEPRDLAVAVSASEATPGHIQRDNGTIVIGSGGRWLIDDPGYQQYLAGPEQEFTLGPLAHNYPVIDGRTQVLPRVERLFCRMEGDSLAHAALELTAAYDSLPGLRRVVRELWLRGGSLVVVADRVQGAGLDSLQYAWQGHPEVAWWLQDNAWLLHCEGASLWLQSPQAAMDGPELTRLPGTRGQLTLVKQLTASDDNRIWWVFNLGPEPVSCEPGPDGSLLTVRGEGFTAEFRALE